MTGLDEYSTEGEGQQKQTHITLSNPDHPDSSSDYADHETMQEHFRAAQAIKNSSINRKMLVGDFLVAIEKEVVQGEEEAIEEFLQTLSE